MISDIDKLKIAIYFLMRKVGHKYLTVYCVNNILYLLCIKLKIQSNYSLSMYGASNPDFLPLLYELINKERFLDYVKTRKNRSGCPSYYYVTPAYTEWIENLDQEIVKPIADCCLQFIKRSRYCRDTSCSLIVLVYFIVRVMGTYDNITNIYETLLLLDYNISVKYWTYCWRDMREMKLPIRKRYTYDNS